jgi:uncharacterized protein (UPF0335 family)
MTKTITNTKVESIAAQSAFSITNLRSFVERIERLEAQKEDFVADIKEVYKEASMQGFDVSTMRKVVKLRKADSKKLEEQEHLLNLYKDAIGM